MNYEEMLVQERARRHEEAERKRAQAQVDAELASAARRKLGEDLVREVTGGTTTFAVRDSREDVATRLQEALGLRRAPSAKPANDAPKVDPDGDPLELLSDEDKAMVERRPYLKRILLADIEKAEAKDREAREHDAALAERDRAHAENDHMHGVAVRIVEQRAKARGNQ